MTPPPGKRYSLRWNPPNVAALFGLSLAFAALLAGHHADRPLGTGETVRVDPERVAAGTERVNPNTAGAVSLQRLPGIGPGRAKAIVAYRRANGPAPFRKAGDLAAVRGIGDTTIGHIEPLLAFTLPPASRPTAPEGTPETP